MNIKNRIRNSALVRDTRGANMVEYIVLVGLVALICIAGFKLFGGSIKEKITNQATAVGGINATGG